MEAVADWFDAHTISMFNGLAVGMLLFLMAAGLSLIFGLVGVFNLAHGAIFFLGGYLAFQVAGGGRLFWAALILALAVGAVLGGLLFLSVQPIRGRGHLSEALLTFGFGFMLQDAIAWIWGRDYESIPAPDFLKGSVTLFGERYPTYRLGLVAAGLAVAAILYVVIERTQIGAIVRAALVDRPMVAALGINVNVVLASMFVIGTALAAFGGVIAGPFLGLRPGLDVQVLILTLIVVVIGGLGSLKGAFVGAIVVGEVQTLGVALLPELASFMLFGIMALVLLVRPEGLFGDVTAR